MCGIIFSKRFDGHNTNRDIKKLYFSQNKRGRDGFGFVNIQNGGHFRAKYEHEILKALKCNKSSEILFHHRNPTSTDNTIDTAHPICSNGNYEHKYYLVHNGVIKNCDKLYNEHILTYELEYTTKEQWTGADGKPYFIFNDSESLLHELALVIEGKKKKEDFDAIGPMAFVMLQTSKDNKPIALYYGRNYSSPLKLLRKDKIMMLTSEGEGDLVETDNLYKYDYNKNEITSEKLTFHAIHPSYWQHSRNELNHNGIEYDTKGYNDKVYNELMKDMPICLLPNRTITTSNGINLRKNGLVVVKNGKMYGSIYDTENEDPDTPKEEDELSIMSVEGLIAEKEEMLASIDIAKLEIKNLKVKDEIIEMSREIEYFVDRVKLIENELAIRGSYDC